MLLTSAPPSEIVALGETLRRLHADEPQAFDALFDPAGPRCLTEVRSPEVGGRLCRFGLAEGEGGTLFGCHRIRRTGGHLYVMELGGVSEYLQDVWPETDALLAALDGAAPGTLLDLGTGCGIVAIEAAARGHKVIATDIYDTALELARFNATMNRVTIEFRAGDVFAPVAGERFDRILTAPHYTRMAAQLRLEVLREGPRHLAPGGTLLLATMMESAPGSPPSVIGPVLEPLAKRGMRVQLRPIPSPVKREWFTDAHSEPAIDGLVSRHRFAITVENREPGGIDAQEPGDRLPQFFVPLARLSGESGKTAVISTAGDLGRLRALLDDLARGKLEFSEGVPSGFLDLCRFGQKPCVRAAEAILDDTGGVRPCAHSSPYGNMGDGMAQIAATHKKLTDELEARRGCASCSARSACSQCLFPFSIDETGYCELIRAHAPTLPRLHRLHDLLGRLSRAHGPLPSLTVAIGPIVPLPEVDQPDAISSLSRRWREKDAWLVIAGEQRWLSLPRERKFIEAEIDELAAEIALRVAAGAGASDLEPFPSLRLSGRPGQRALQRLARALG
jgi:SAM-dependent methyltransferase